MKKLTSFLILWYIGTINARGDQRNWLLSNLLPKQILPVKFTTNVENEQGNETQSPFLPRHISPIKYTLTVFTDLDDSSFSGNVVIEVSCKTPTKLFTLHAKDLAIEEKNVLVKQITSDNKEMDVTVVKCFYEDKYDFYSILLNDNCNSPSTYRIYILFEGTLKEISYGYYKISYVEEETGQTKWMTVTKFSPAGARLCFPCMDEPDLKAKFQIFLGHPPNLQAMSNMPKKGAGSPLIYNDKKDWIMDEFVETELMSTYLVAFALAEYEYIEMPVIGTEKTVGIWIRKELRNQIELAKTTVSGALKFYIDYFAVDYALPKLDLVSVPQQSNTGTENYGMVTLSESAITFDPYSSNVMDQYGTAQVICHVTCQQWFGNYVTIKWWNDLFLKEGLASYFEDICVAHIFPEWKSLDQMIFRKYLNALTADEVLSSHPLIISVTNPDDINQYFDSITSDKDKLKHHFNLAFETFYFGSSIPVEALSGFSGAMVMRMMRTFLTESVFEKALTKFLNKHKYDVATADDLWNEMAAEANAANISFYPLTVKTIMDSWTLQDGFPYVMVKVDYLSKSVELTQRRFISEEVPQGVELPKKCWNIPVSYTTSRNPNFNNAEPKCWITCDKPFVIYDLDIMEGDWILTNIAVAGFLRTNFETENWLALERTLSTKNLFNVIGILDRAQIISNSFDMAWINELKYEITFKIVSYLINETEYIPWRTALESLRVIRDSLLRTEIIQFFENFVRQFLEPQFNSIGDIRYIPDDFMSYRYDTLIIYWACIYSVQNCHDQSIQIFQEWKGSQKPDENNPILPNLRDIVYCEAMKTGGEEVFNFMWDRFFNSQVPTEQSTILTAIGCSGDANILQRILDWSLGSTKISKEQSTLVYYTVAIRTIGFEVAKNFLLNDFANIVKYHGQGSQKIGEYLEILASLMTSEEELNEFQKFVDSQKDQLKGNEVSVQTAISSIKDNLAWRKRNYDELKLLLMPSAK